MSLHTMVARLQRGSSPLMNFPGISVAEAKEAMGEAWYLTDAIERVIQGVWLPINNKLARVPYTQFELEWASKRGFRLVPSCCTVAQLARVAPGLVRTDTCLIPLSDVYRTFSAFDWHLVQAYEDVKEGGAVPPKAFSGRSTTPSLAVYLLTRFLEFTLKGSVRYTAPRLTSDVLSTGNRIVLSQDNSKGCPVFAANLTAPGSLIPEAKAWRPHMMVAR